MLEIYGRVPSEHGAPLIRGAEFLRVELSQLADGQLHVALIATTVDEEAPQLLDQEITRRCVATMDDVVALLRAHVRVASALLS